MAAVHVEDDFIQSKITARGGGVEACHHGGRVRTHNTVGLLPAATEVGSTLSLGKISSSANLLPSSTIFWDAMGASVTASLGFKDNAAIGVASKTAALVSGANVATAGNASAISAVNIDKTGKKLWEILGLAADPKQDLDLVLTTAGATSAAGGHVAVDLYFAID